MWQKGAKKIAAPAPGPLPVTESGPGLFQSLPLFRHDHEHFPDGLNDVPPPAPALGEDDRVPGRHPLRAPVGIRQEAHALENVEDLRRGPVHHREAPRRALPRTDGDGAVLAQLRRGPAGHPVVGVAPVALDHQLLDGAPDHALPAVGLRGLGVADDHEHLVDRLRDVPPAAPALRQHHRVARAPGVLRAVEVRQLPLTLHDVEHLRGGAVRGPGEAALGAEPRAHVAGAFLVEGPAGLVGRAPVGVLPGLRGRQGAQGEVLGSGEGELQPALHDLSLQASVCPSRTPRLDVLLLFSDQPLAPLRVGIHGGSGTLQHCNRGPHRCPVLLLSLQKTLTALQRFT
mmetsp:Transcript_38021/g.63173  ORF Transcript_38021/g.63173 Transcript_38021/m.63173 type:complete len:343 (+) Transcript_38021:926-1954(+)